MLKKLIKKLTSKEFLIYIVFGILTTVVNYAVYTWMYTLMGTGSALVANVIAFAVSVLFAFFTNKPFVFASKSWAPAVVTRELITFTGSRLFSFGIEELGILMGQNLLHLESWSLWGINGLVFLKLPLSVITVLLNYFFSKFVVFRKNKKES